MHKLKYIIMHLNIFYFKMFIMYIFLNALSHYSPHPEERFWGQVWDCIYICHCFFLVGIREAYSS